ncbi:conserved protein of unknown function [Alteromonas macleodii]|uniref:Peptidase M15A C-terminal domain-containing protein n=2 Tax=Alteromonas macleodii TaxID=28108 RepID=A0A6T9XUS5_ALTMA|nr:conserved protein of unknown function [Alteromonas macleodii]
MMDRMHKLNSQETAQALNISDCELMHLRERGGIAYEKRGRAFFYSLPVGHSVLAHPLGQSLLNWYKSRHDFSQSNEPIADSSILALEELVSEILLPVNRTLGKPIITYGFTSFPLKKFIQKASSSGTAPTLDQHSSHETNSMGKQICSRGGAACDFFVEGVATSDIVRFITQRLNYDRIYYYGNNRPFHVSIHLTEPLKHLQIMCESVNGRRYPGRKAFGDQAVILAEDL